MARLIYKWCGRCGAVREHRRIPDGRLRCTACFGKGPKPDPKVPNVLRERSS